MFAAGPPSGFTTDIVGCWGGSTVESLQSHCIHTQFHWSRGLTLCFPSWGTRVQPPGGYWCETGIFLLAYWSSWSPLLPIMRDTGGSIPRGVLMWNQDFPVSVVSLHWWPRRDWSLWPCLRRTSSQTVTRLSCRQCDNPTWSSSSVLVSCLLQVLLPVSQPHSRLLGGSPV